MNILYNLIPHISFIFTVQFLLLQQVYSKGFKNQNCVVYNLILQSQLFPSHITHSGD